jgi:hypothetical protein
VFSTRPAEALARRDEDGQIIVIALAFLVVAGVLVGALASLATPVFAHAKVVQTNNEAVAATNAGIEYGISTLQTVFPLSQAFCPSTGGSVRGVPPVNGLTANLVCSSTPYPGQSQISQVVLSSTSGSGRTFGARAVVLVNNLTGATAIQSWRTCQDPGPTC